MQTPKQQRWEIEDDRARYITRHAERSIMAATAPVCVSDFPAVIAGMSDAHWQMVLDAYMEGYEAKYDAWLAEHDK